VCAPSDNWDDLGATNPAGRGITTTDNEGFGVGSDFAEGSRFTNQFGGTSSATPTVAGVCGLILSANPSLAANEVRAILQETADKDGLSQQSDTPVNESGAFNNGFSLWFGYGKVNARKAVEAAAAGVAAERLVTFEERPDLEIPDLGAPVTSSITVEDNGSINELRISVDISHTYIGDLRVDLIAPDGTSFVLHDNEGGSSRDLVRTYSAQQIPALRPLIGAPCAGEWRLRVVDQFRFDIGRVNSWRIAARLAAPIQNVASLTRRRRRVA
jgi:subtilisin-like proprotein convertase family protein